MEIYRLEKWGVTVHPDDNPYLAPEQIRSSLFGEVYGHPRFDDGTVVITSYILSTGVRSEGTDLVVTRSGSLYELGEVNDSYEKEFPGAKERLFKRLKELRKEGDDV